MYVLPADCDVVPHWKCKVLMMYNIKERYFNFQIFDYLRSGNSHFLLGQDDIKILDSNLILSCRIPIQIDGPYEKLAISADYILLMRNDFTLIGCEEWPVRHAPVMELLLLDNRGRRLAIHNVENAYGHAIEIREGRLNFVYSVFGQSGETETKFLSANEYFKTFSEHVLHRDQCIMDFPVCEAVFDSAGRAILFNSDGEFFLWDLNGSFVPLIFDTEDHLYLIRGFHEIRNLQFCSEGSEIVLSYSTGRVLRYLFCTASRRLKLKMETGTGSESSHQFVLKGYSDDRIISSRRGETIIYKRSNAIRFIMMD